MNAGVDLFDRQIKIQRFQKIPFGGKRVLYAVDGQPDQPISMLRQAVDQGWRNPLFAVQDPKLDSLRELPEFKELMRSVEFDVDTMRERVMRADAENSWEALIAENVPAQARM